MMVRTQISLDRESHARAKRRAAAQGISLAEYMRRLVESDLERPGKQADISAIFGLFRSDEPTDIAKDKDRMLDESVWEDHLRSTGQKEERG